MKKVVVICLTGFFFAVGACQDENSSLGESLVESSFRNVFTDTCTVDISTILVDSLETLGDTLFQLGYMNDSVFGRIRASYYAEFHMKSFSPVASKAYQFDSLTLTIRPSGHYWGDTLAQQRIHVHAIKNPILLLTGETLYNTSQMEVEDEPLFSFTYTPRPGWKKEHEIRMPDSFGQQLFDDMLAEKEVFDSQEKFRGYLPGLALIPDDTGNCITGVLMNDSSVCMRMYYQVLDKEAEEMELLFSPNGDHAYARIEHDRTGVPVEGLSPGGAFYATSSVLTGHKAYLQGLTGIYCVIEFPYLNHLMTNGDIVSLESATLYLYPQYGTYGTSSPLPETLRLYVADDKNNTVDQIYDSMGEDVQDGSLTVNELSAYETCYSFDLTEFLRDNLGTWGQTRQKLFLILDDNDFITTFGHVVFANDRSLEAGQTRLEIRFKTYDK